MNIALHLFAIYCVFAYGFGLAAMIYAESAQEHTNRIKLICWIISPIWVVGIQVVNFWDWLSR